ncbi:TolB family protein [Mesorhizobium sp. ArgA1]
MHLTLRSFSMLVAGIVAALCGPAAAQDYAGYRVLDTRVIENMWTSAGQKAALLSPDGSRVLHLNDPEFCLLAPSQVGPWAKIGCAQSTPENRPGEAADMFWSPSGSQLLMPTYTNALLAFRDTDIRLVDPTTFAVRNLTEDNFDGSILKGKGPANLDLLAHWIDSNTIVFVRCAIPAGGFTQGASTSLMTIKADGGDPQLAFEITAKGKFQVWAMTVSGDGKQVAYSLADKDNPDKAGIYLLNLGEATPKRIASTIDAGQPAGMAFSADGKFLLLLGRTASGVDAKVIDLASGKIVPVDHAQNVVGVAWSPKGSALAYITYDRKNADMPGGLFLAEAPGKPARLLIGGGLFPTVCCGQEPFIWASNDTMILAQLGDKIGSVLFVKLGQ